MPTIYTGRRFGFRRLAGLWFTKINARNRGKTNCVANHVEFQLIQVRSTLISTTLVKRLLVTFDIGSRRLTEPESRRPRESNGRLTRSLLLSIAIALKLEPLGRHRGPIFKRVPLSPVSRGTDGRRMVGPLRSSKPETFDSTRFREFDFRDENPGMRISGNSATVFWVAANLKSTFLA
jgi:hypothetical protein